MTVFTPPMPLCLPYVCVNTKRGRQPDKERDTYAHTRTHTHAHTHTPFTHAIALCALFPGLPCKINELVGAESDPINYEDFVDRVLM